MHLNIILGFNILINAGRRSHGVVPWIQFSLRDRAAVLVHIQIGQKYILDNAAALLYFNSINTPSVNKYMFP